MVQESRRIYEFGPFRLDAAAPLLWREGEPVYLTPKALDTLVVLVERAGQLIKREELIEAVWPDTIVEENNLSVNISGLRKALGDGYIQTVPRRGYRFTMPVRDVSVAVPSEAVEALQPAVVKYIRAGYRVRGRVARPVRWVVAVALLAFGIALLKTSGNEGRREPAAAPLAGALGAATRGKTLLVLPFTSSQWNGFIGNITGSGGRLADEVTARLSRLNNVEVVPAAVVSAAQVTPHNLLLAAHSLGADAVLTGVIFRNDAEEIRVRSHLVSVNGGEVLWADTMVVQPEAFDQLPESVARNVSAGMEKLAGREEYERRARRLTTSRKAYQHYLQGRFLWEHRSDVFVPSDPTAVESPVASVNHFEQARLLDPNFALAYVGLADHQKTSPYGSPEMLQAEENARTAITLAPQLAEPHATLGFIRMIHHWDWSGAEAEFKRALELNPHCITAHQWYALFHALRGNSQEAIKEITRARELAPYSLSVLVDAAELRYFSAHYGVAIALLEEILELHPGAINVRRLLGEAYWMNGDRDKALALVEWQGTPHQFALSEVRPEKCAGGHTLVSYNCARWNAALNRTGAALDFLEVAYREHHFFMPFIGAEPFFRDLRDEPRFRELCRRIGIPDEFSLGIFR